MVSTPGRTPRCRRGRAVLALLLSVATLGLWPLATAAPASATGTPGLISTVAGSIVPGPASATAIGQTPIAVALYPAGNPTYAYVADVEYHVVRRITLATGQEIVYAGTGVTGSTGDGGAATSATLTTPVGVAVDGSGNLFIADRDANRVRKVTPGGTITTVAGGATGFAVSAPSGLAVDGSGNLFIADRGDNLVRRLTPANSFTTVAGGGTGGDGGPATSASLNAPVAVAVSGSTIYVSDMFDLRIRSFTVGGTIQTVVGTGTAAPLSGTTSTGLNYPQGLAVDPSGNLLYADTLAHVVRRVTGSTVTTVAGTAGQAGTSPDGTAAASGHLFSPWGLAVDGAGKVYVAGVGDHLLRTFTVGGTLGTAAGTSLAVLGDGGTATAAQLQEPSSVAVDGSDVYVADTGNCLVRKLSGGVLTTVAGTGTCGDGGSGPATTVALDHPRGVAVAGGVLYIADTGNGKIRAVTGGSMTTVAGTGGATTACVGGPATSTAMGAPAAVAVDGSGALLVADSTSNCVRRISGGTMTTVAGSTAGTIGGSGDGGPATGALLSGPAGVAVDASGTVYVADTGNNRIRRFTVGGTITTVAGTGAAGATGDGGPATAAALTAPGGVSVDSVGRLYVADSGNSEVRLVTRAGLITKVAGSTPGFAGDGGIGVAALLTNPTDVTVLPTGDMVIADAGNDRVRTVNAFGPPSAATNVQATAGSRSAEVDWQAPSDNGGAPVSRYTVTASTNGATCVTSATTCTVYGLDADTPVTFTVKADNDFGVSTSAPSNQISPLGAYGLHPTQPTRILDSRTGAGGYSTPWGQFETRSVQVAGAGPVPATGVSAVVMNMTVTATTAPGFLTVFPTGTQQPTASSLNWAAGDTVANLVTVPVGPDGKVNIYNQAGSTHVIADVVGWYDTGSGGGQLFTPVSPARILDTRDGTGLSGAFSPYTTRDLVVAGRGGVPADATSVVLNVTVTDTDAPAFLTVYPAGTARPTASNLNWVAGTTRANLVTVGLGGGNVSIYVHASHADVVADVVGYYSASGLGFYPLPPTRILDSRTGNGGYTTPWPQFGTRDVAVGGSGPVPSVAQAALMNVTATDTTQPGYLTLWPAGTTKPTASNLNWAPGQTVPNLAAVKLGSGGNAGAMSIYNHQGQTDVVADVVGWFG